MSAHSRTKGIRAELEAAAIIHALTGWEVARKVRQHQGDSDLSGCEDHGWSVECKRHATASRADIAAWWNQAEAQAIKAGKRALLMYRVDRGEWRAVWALSGWTGYMWTADGSPEAWAAFARENA